MPDKRIRIEDKRKVSAVNGAPVNNARTGDYDFDTIANIVKAAKDEGVDPYTAIAISLQESAIGTKHPNIGQVNYDILKKDQGKMERFTKATSSSPNPTYKTARELAFMLRESADEAKKLGYDKDEAMQLQAYNGYGKVGANNDIGAKTLYGVDLTRNTIDMRKTPMYGQTIVDLRENIIKQNPDIKEMVEAFNMPDEDIKGVQVSKVKTEAGQRYIFKRGNDTVGEVEGADETFKSPAAEAAHLKVLYNRMKKANNTMATIKQALGKS